MLLAASDTPDKEFEMPDGTSASYGYSSWKIDARFDVTLNLARYGSCSNNSDTTQWQLNAKRVPKEGMFGWFFRPWKSQVKSALKQDIRDLLKTFRHKTIRARPGASEELVASIAKRLLVAVSPSGKIPTKKGDVDKLIVQLFQDGWFNKRRDVRQKNLEVNCARLLHSIDRIAGQSKLISRQELMNAVHMVADREEKANTASERKFFSETAHFRLSDDSSNEIKWSFSGRSLNKIRKHNLVEDVARKLIRTKVEQFLWKFSDEPYARASDTLPVEEQSAREREMKKQPLGETFNLGEVIKRRVSSGPSREMVEQFFQELEQEFRKTGASEFRKTGASVEERKMQQINDRTELLEKVLKEAQRYKDSDAAGAEAFSFSFAGTESGTPAFAEPFKISAEDVEIIEKMGLLRRVTLTPRINQIINRDAIKEMLGQRAADAITPLEDTMIELVLNDPDPEALLEDLENKDLNAWFRLAVEYGQKAELWTNKTNIEDAGLKEAFDALLVQRAQACLEGQALLSVRQTAMPGVNIVEVPYDTEVEWETEDPQKHLPTPNRPLGADLFTEKREGSRHNKVIILLPGLVIGLEKYLIEDFENFLSGFMKSRGEKTPSALEGTELEAFLSELEEGFLERKRKFSDYTIARTHARLEDYAGKSVLTTADTVLVLPAGKHILNYHKGQDEHRTIDAMMACLNEIEEWDNALFKYNLEPDSGRLDRVSESGVSISQEMREKYEWLVESGRGLGGLLLNKTKREDLIDQWVAEQLSDDAGYLEMNFFGKVVPRHDKHPEDVVGALARYVLDKSLDADDADPREILFLALYLERYKMDYDLFFSTKLPEVEKLIRKAEAARDQLLRREMALRDFVWAFPNGELYGFFRRCLDKALKQNGVDDMSFDEFYKAMRRSKPDRYPSSNPKNITEVQAWYLMNDARSYGLRETAEAAESPGQQAMS